MWAVEIVDLFVFRGGLDGFGIRPRRVDGLAGILFAPFLHGGFDHLAANSGPCLILGVLTYLVGRSAFFRATAISILVGGAGVWVFGEAASVHVGASGVVFGYFGFLAARGYYERTFGAVLVALLVIFLFGGLLYGLSPLQRHVSWLGHLFGLLGGVGAASRTFCNWR